MFGSVPETCHADLDPDQEKGKANEVDTLGGHDPGLETGTIGMSEAEAETGADMAQEAPGKQVLQLYSNCNNSNFRNSC